MRKLIIASILFLAACATSSDPRLARVERVTQFCDGFAETLNVLATMRELDKLTPIQVERVSRAVLVMDPICHSDVSGLSKPLPDQAFDMVLMVNSIVESNK